MFRAKQHSWRLKSLSDLTFVFLSDRDSVSAGRGIDSGRETWGRRREEGGPGVKRVNKVERRAEDADGVRDKKRNVVFLL